MNSSGSAAPGLLQEDVEWIFHQPYLILHEGPFVARIANDTVSSEIQGAYRLRYSYFVKQKGWVEEPRIQGSEQDAYDPHCLHLCVSHQEQIVAYLRVLPHQPKIGFMLEGEFACLLSGAASPIIHNQAVELSRLVYGPSPMFSKEGTTHPVEVLLKLLYRLAVNQGFERFYIVVEEKWIRPFARRFGLAFTPLSTPYVFPDGTRTVAATATLSELQESMKAHSLAKYEWYHSF